MDLSPLRELRLRTPRLELRLPSEAELIALARVAEAGVHQPDQMPFLVPWTDPSETFVSDFVAYHRTVRTAWRPQSWRLELGVFAGEQPIGMQAIHAERFREARATGSASWLGLPYHGLGYGTEMRTAVLELAFSGLGATHAGSGAFKDNFASARVSQTLGYDTVGERWRAVRGRPALEDRFVLARERFQASARIRVVITGLRDCLPLFDAAR